MTTKPIDAASQGNDAPLSPTFTTGYSNDLADLPPEIAGSVGAPELLSPDWSAGVGLQEALVVGAQPGDAQNVVSRAVGRCAVADPGVSHPGVGGFSGFL